LLQRQVEGAGVKVMVGEKVTGVKGRKKVTGITTGNAELACDLVVWATGVRPNTALAKQAGIEIGQLGGIKVNDKMETSIEHVYACGDCVQVWDQTFGKPCLSLLWASAKEQAAVAAANCLGEPRSYPGALSVVIEEIAGLTAVSVGATEDALRNAFACEDFTVQEQETQAGYLKVIADSQRILGAQFVGNYQGAGAVAAWMRQGISPEEIKGVLANREQLKWAPWYAHGASVAQLLA
ncbi:MAG: FAD-dependent oxidoreductase, partial [Clostridia bacterium]|nr:FAD-dependent oxidoreductase [Clostridia bacterium]